MHALQDIEQECSKGSVQTMNRFFGVLGLRLSVGQIIVRLRSGLLKPHAFVRPV